MNTIGLFILTLILPLALPAKKGINYENKKIHREVSSALKIDQGSFSTKTIDIPAAIQLPDSGRYYTVNKDDSIIGYLYVGRVFTCPVGGCDSKAANTGGSFEYFDYLAVFNNDLSISRVTVFNYQATHGHEICSRGWLNQFDGFGGGSTLRVGKEIDSISGATKSTTSITESIMVVQNTLGRLTE